MTGGLLLGATIAVAVMLLAIAWLVYRVPVLGATRSRSINPGDQAARTRRISVIIPARNEERDLPLLLADLQHQSLPAHEVIVVDDGSDDATAAVAAELALVERVELTPFGWNPKVWAMVEGVDRASGDTLVFFDADVRVGPETLAELVAANELHGGLVSVSPHHNAVGPMEALSAVCNVIAVAGGGPGFNRRQAQGAVGGCMIIDADTYHQCGGHRATPSTIVDDLDLAATVRGAGLANTLYRGGSLVTMRGYPDGFGDICRGWVKNMAAGAQRTQALVGLAVAGWLTALILPVVLLALGQLVAAAALTAVVGIHGLAVTPMVGRFDRRVVGLAAPLLGLFTAGLTALSAFRRLTGRTTAWKGRPLKADGLVGDDFDETSRARVS